MGRRRFRLADMMPNSWFYKLRDMRRPPRGQGGHPPAPAAAVGGAAASAMLPSSSPPPPQRGTTRPASPRRGSVALPHRSSYYYPTRTRDDRKLPAPETKQDADEEEEDRRRVFQAQQQQSPPKSYSRRRHRIGRGREAALAGEAHDAHHQSRRRRDMYVGRDEEDAAVEVVRRPAVTTAPPSSGYSMSGNGKVIASETDIVIDLCSDHGTAERVLRPIVTRPAMREVVRHVADMTSVASEEAGQPRRPSTAVSVGRRLRTRVNSPRLAAAAAASARSTRKSSSKPTAAAPPPLAESFAVVKSSADPRRDFRESMEEMIAEKGIRGAADLEDLLACYLALNAREHHGLIVQVFEEIWAGLAAGAGAGEEP